MKKISSIILVLMAVILMVTLSGCRKRIVFDAAPAETADVVSEKAAEPEPPSASPKPEPQRESKLEATPSPNPDPTIEPETGKEPERLSEQKPTPNPEAKPEEEQQESEPPTDNGSTTGGVMASGENQGVNTEPSEEPEMSVRNPDADDGQAKPSDTGSTVGAIIDEYTNLLNEGFGSLYECQVPYVYLELETDFLTVNRKSDLHRLILESGGYNTAEKLLDGALTIDTAWIKRKNPDVVVKFVGSSALGAGIADTRFASELYAGYTSRDGWNEISAVLNQNIVLLSAELLETEYGKFAAKLYIAKAMYPTLFSEMDVDSVCHQVLQSSGTYFYHP